MFRGDWLPVSVMGGVLVAGMAIIFALLASVISNPSHDGAAVSIGHDCYAYCAEQEANSILPPISVPQIKTQPVAEDRTTPEQADAHDDDGSIKWTDIAIVGLTLVLALCGIAGSVIAYFQWAALRDQVSRLDSTIEKSDATSERQAGEMKDSLAHAARSAKAMEDVAVSMATNLTNVQTMIAHQKDFWNKQMRAYITIGNGPFFAQYSNTGFRLQMDVATVNVGLTPARNVAVAFKTDVLPHP
jgi:hypothetical protein